MTDKLREAAQAALEALEKNLESLACGVTFNMTQAAIESLRAALAAPDVNPWREAVHDALTIGWSLTEENHNDPRKAIADLIAWETQIALDPAVSSDAQALINRGRQEALAAPNAGEPVEHSIVAGALYDFMGWLTTRDEPITLGATQWALPAADAIVAFAAMRGLNIDNPRVAGWQHVLTTPPQDAETITVRLTREQHEELCEIVYDRFQYNLGRRNRVLALLGTFPDADAEGPKS